MCYTGILQLHACVLFYSEILNCTIIWFSGIIKLYHWIANTIFDQMWKDILEFEHLELFDENCFMNN